MLTYFSFPIIFPQGLQGQHILNSAHRKTELKSQSGTRVWRRFPDFLLKQAHVSLRDYRQTTVVDLMNLRAIHRVHAGQQPSVLQLVLPPEEDHRGNIQLDTRGIQSSMVPPVPIPICRVVPGKFDIHILISTLSPHIPLHFRSCHSPPRSIRVILPSLHYLRREQRLLQVSSRGRPIVLSPITNQHH